MNLYKGIFGEPCMNFVECGNYTHIHGSLCPDCAEADVDGESDIIVVCAGCGSTDDGFGFANGTCANCGSMSFDILDSERNDTQ